VFNLQGKDASTPAGNWFQDLHVSHIRTYIVYAPTYINLSYTYRYTCIIGLHTQRQSCPYEDVWGSGCIDPHFLDLGTSCSKWSASRHCRFTPGKELPVLITQEVGRTPELVWTTWRRENSWTYRDSNSDPAVGHPVASRHRPTEIHTYIMSEVFVAIAGFCNMESMAEVRFCEQSKGRPVPSLSGCTSSHPQYISATTAKSKEMDSTHSLGG
jgi:hypothetical protein